LPITFRIRLIYLHNFTLAKPALILIILSTGVLFFYGLGRIPLVGPDEPRYSQVAREMFDRSDPITPTLGQRVWFEKPVLLYWWMMISYGLFGVSEFSARLGSAVSASIIVLLLSLLAKRIFNETTYTVSVALSSAGLIVFSRAASFDIIVTMTLTLTFCSFFLAEVEEKRRGLYLALFYAGMGLSLLAKGLIGVVIPLGTLSLYFLLQRRAPRIRDLGLYWGPLITVAVAALWYAPSIVIHGETFIREFFINHHFMRYISNKYRHQQPFYFYLPVLLMLALPWSVLLISSLFRGRLIWPKQFDKESRLQLFAKCWLIFPVLFFSLSGSKLPAYILPSLPAGVLLVASRLREIEQKGGSWELKVTSLLMVLVPLAALLFSSKIDELSPLCMALICSPLILAGALTLIIKSLSRWYHYIVLGSITLSIAVTINCALERVAGHESVRDLLSLASAKGYRESPVTNLLVNERTSEFYASGRIVYAENGSPLRFESIDELVEYGLRSDSPFLTFLPAGDWQVLRNEKKLLYKFIGENRKWALVAVHRRQT
jgi:4-amino-4-deoxy-L-arabinose transferase-like glycosyltransferase